MQKKSLVGLVFLLFIAIVVYVVWHAEATHTAYQYTPTFTAETALISDNPNYSKARASYIAGDYAGALQAYEAALPGKDAIQEGQIWYNIGLATELDKTAGGYLAAIPIYKKIAANTSFTPITRATAVQEMGLLYANYGDPKITTSIFSEQPYQSMYDAQDLGVTYRRLFEYATSLYPLAISETRIANWYATQIYNSDSGVGPKLDQTTIDSYKQTIHNNLAAADVDLKRMEQTPNEQGNMIQLALQREGITRGMLQITGDNSFGDAVATLQQVVSMYDKAGVPGSDGFARFYLAYYLGKLQPDSQAQVQQTLAPIYTDQAYASSSLSVTPAFRAARTGFATTKAMLVYLAGIDPKFKAYLETLGWSASDFAQ